MDFFTQLKEQDPILFQKHFKLAPFFKDRSRVLELGSALGVFLNLMRENSITAEGLDNDKALANQCKKQGLIVHLTDGLKFLKKTKKGSFDGFFCSNVIEHLSPGELNELLDIVCSKLSLGGKLALMTSNPKALGIHADVFYAALDHKRLYPLALLQTMLTQRGMTIVKACEDEDSRQTNLLRSVIRKLRSLLIGPFFGPPEIFISAVKSEITFAKNKSHMTYYRKPIK